MAQGSASIVSEKAAWLSPNILILLILLRTQHYEKPWTRAEFCFPSHPKRDVSPLVIAMVWNRTVFYRPMYLNACSLVGSTVFENCEAEECGVCLAEMVTVCGPLKIQPSPGSPLVSLASRPRSHQKLHHMPLLLLTRFLPLLHLPNQDGLYFLKARARRNPSFYKYLSARHLLKAMRRVTSAVIERKQKMMKTLCLFLSSTEPHFIVQMRSHMSALLLKLYALVYVHIWRRAKRSYLAYCISSHTYFLRVC